jgi:hypothetical protein
MFGGPRAGPAAMGPLPLSIEDLRVAFREFDLDKNGCVLFVTQAA